MSGWLNLGVTQTNGKLIRAFNLPSAPIEEDWTLSSKDRQSIAAAIRVAALEAEYFNS